MNMLFVEHWKEAKYTIIVQGFSDDSEKNMLVCLNITMTVKREALWMWQMLQIISEHRHSFCKQLESDLWNNKHTNYPRIEYSMYFMEAYMMDSLIHL